MSILIKEVKAEQTYPIRQSELRKGFSLENCYMEGDEKQTTFHLGAFDNNTIVGVVSLMKTAQGYQLRGMAILESYKGQKIGTQLIEKAEEQLKNKCISTIWMNARINAVNFYQKQGYTSIGNPFTIEGIGEHIRMSKKLV